MAKTSPEPAAASVKVSQRDMKIALPKGGNQEKMKEKKRQNVLTRTLWTFIMIFGFIGTMISLFHSPFLILS
jgi:preprotein translocase subunit SecG